MTFGMIFCFILGYIVIEDMNDRRKWEQAEHERDISDRFANGTLGSKSRKQRKRDRGENQSGDS